MIVRSRGGRTQLRANTLADFGIPSVPGDSEATGGVPLTPATAAGIPAIGAAVRLAAQSVAVLELGVWKGPRLQPTRVTSVWQARFFAGEMNDQQTSFVFKETVEESLSYRGNGYVWKNVDPVTGRVTELYALHPDQVLPVLIRKRRTYYVVVAPGFVDPVGKGFGFYEVGEETILHIKGHGDGGQWIAPSPIERYAKSLGSALSKITHEAGMYARGASLKLAVEFPDKMQQDKVNAWREMWKATYEGPGNAGRTAVIGGGGTIKPIGMTLADAQFTESQQFSVEEAARIIGVPASLIGGGGVGGTARAAAPITPEHEQDRWFRIGLIPRLLRIEGAFKADPAIFPPGSAYYPMFDTQGAVRSDLQTEDAISHQQIQDGRLTVNEWRADHGRPPLPGGDVPQIVPVGGAPNPDPAAPSPAAPTPASTP